MTSILTLGNYGIATYVLPGNPDSSVLGAQINDVYCNSNNGMLFNCLVETFGSQAWLGADGTVIGAPISSPLHPAYIAKWTMDNVSGSIVVDDSPNGNDGDAFGGGVFTAGKVGNAYATTQGSAQGITISGLPATLADDIAIAMWYKTTDRTNAGALFSYRDSTNALLQIFQQGGSDVRSQIRGASGGSLGSISGTLPANNVWQFVVLNVSLTTGRELFINSASAGTENTSLSGSVSSNLSYLSMYNFGAGVHPNNGLKGAVDQVCLFNRKLTQPEINTLYNGGAGV